MRAGPSQRHSRSDVEPRWQRQVKSWSDRLARNPFKRAWRAIAVATVVVAVAGGLLARLTDPEIVMLAGLSLLGVTTAAVTNAFAEAAARRRDEA
jgi:hypothetical protein